MKHNSRSQRNILQDRRGNVAMTFGLTAAIAVGAIGAAVDYGRAFAMRSKLQYAVDTAVISGLTKYKETQDWTAAQTTANTVFSATFTGYENQLSTAPVPSFTNDGTSLSGSANASIVTPFLSIATSLFGDATTYRGSSTMSASSGGNLSGATSTTTAGRKLEVSMMIDLTGSMGWSDASGSNYNSKIDALKYAGKDLLDIILPASGQNDNAVRVAIAPFADYVNAGSFAAAATGLTATGGAYTNINNLASTKNGPFSGSYSGLTGGSSGNQSGSTSSTSTFDNGYCANPTTTTAAVVETHYDSQFGTADKGETASTSAANAVDGEYYKYSNGSWYYYSDMGWSNGHRYGRKYVKINGDWYYYSGYYYNSHTQNLTPGSTTTVAGCESTATTASSQLISCVTERTDSTNRYSDAAPGATAGYVGAYNHGSTSKSNYSSNGKCYTAGRELPEIMPLTNQRSNLVSFFDNMTVGGATPGHLGTAWAWYMLSPNWATVFPSNAPAAYTDAQTKKIAILMSDGEYNVFYANGSASATQALSLCTNMKTAGVEVYTIGFGMGQSVVANANGTAAERAKYTLEQCSSGTGFHYFPYDGTALRAAFTQIGNSLSSQMSTTTTVLGARITQ